MSEAAEEVVQVRQLLRQRLTKQAQRRPPTRGNAAPLRHVSLQATTSPGNPRRAQLGSTAALHGHVGQEERAQRAVGRGQVPGS